MSLKPLQHRILVRPDDQPTETEGGLILIDTHDHVPVSGTVVSVGPGGSQLRYQVRQRAIKDCAEIVESALSTWGSTAALTLVRDEIAGMLGTSSPDRDVAVGDRVVFPAEVGYRVKEDGVEYLILNEDDVAVVVTESEVAA